jgi:hypothetical protein
MIRHPRPVGRSRCRPRKKKFDLQNLSSGRSPRVINRYLYNNLIISSLIFLSSTVQTHIHSYSWTKFSSKVLSKVWNALRFGFDFVFTKMAVNTSEE